jgi:hypothetical protein
MKPPFSSQAFFQMCQEQLTPFDWQILKNSLLSYDGEPSSTNDVFNRWLQFQKGLRNEIAWFRALEFNKDPFAHMRGERFVEPVIIDVVAQAAKAPDPLSAERILDRVRWQKLEELTVGHYFDTAYLVTYALKLQILERYQVINPSKGKEVLRSYQNRVHAQIEEVLAA